MISPTAIRSSPLQRLRPGAKLLGLLVFGLLTVLVQGWPSALVALTLAVGITAFSGQRIREIWHSLRLFSVVAAVLFAFQLWRNGLPLAVEVTADLLALIIVAQAITASTASDDLLDTVVWALRPLQRFGVQPERVAFASSLALRAIPLAAAVARETRSAARARGLERSPRAYLVPFVLRMIAHAQATGAALHARGIGDDDG